MSGVWPFSLWSSTFAPCSSNTFTAFSCPPAHAYISGVFPVADWAFTSAPCLNSSSMMSTWPADAASISGVQSFFWPRSSTCADMAKRT
uniref:Putative secreted peptide n=1 Tax=Anopheles braziliensis TaxID=58242 RepID=A0A2M3ZP99_9DIPT